MSKVLTMSELRNMQEADLLREITRQYRVVAHLNHAVKGGVEKGSHLLKREKIQIARMQTVLSQLRKKNSASTLRAPTTTPSV